MPKVSVVMPVYNTEKYIQEAIESILNQTYTDFEFIIINDGSTDRTKEIIQSYKDSRIRYLENVHNSDIVTTLNKGLDYATGEYIARMDADDIAMKDRLKEQNRFLDRHDEIGVVGSAMIVFNEKGEENLFPYSTTPGMAKAELMFNSSLGHPTVMIRKRCLENIRHEAEYQGLEDFVMWWRIAQRYPIVSLKKPLLKYRKHTDQVTKNRSKEFYDRFNVIYTGKNTCTFGFSAQ
jgi:glycosyltransferase involved in cell wall biosynthesis